MMFWTDWITVIMIGIGAVFMLLSILLAAAMLPRLTDYYKQKWALLTLFKGFFLVGYLAFITILVMDLSLPLELVTGVVFLGGACFVFLVIRLTKYTVTDLSDKEDSLNELNATLEQKVQQRTGALEESLASLSEEVNKREKANKKILSMGEELRLILDTISTGIRVIDLNHTIIQVNKQFCLLTGLSQQELVGSHCYTNFITEDCQDSDGCRLKTIKTNQDVYENIEKKTTRDGRTFHFRVTSAPMFDSDGEVIGLLEDFQNITALVKAQEEKEKAQNHMHQAAKLESVGQLAAGIAHEINTPVQFVSTNLDFLGESFDDIAVFMKSVQLAMDHENTDPGLKQGMEEVDWEFLSEEIPLAIGQSVAGVERVAKLVLAMKEFSHPNTRERAPADIHTILENTITISQNEWSYVADIDRKYSMDFPLVPCLTDELGQVFLNIIVNAGHAIADKVQDSSDKGVITISSTVTDDSVEIDISDTGKGMDDELSAKIFDPFFTTKDVGKGTGQGLSIAHDIVVNKHHGELIVDSTLGTGTTFTVRLPL